MFLEIFWVIYLLLIRKFFVLFIETTVCTCLWMYGTQLWYPFHRNYIILIKVIKGNKRKPRGINRSVEILSILTSKSGRALSFFHRLRSNHCKVTVVPFIICAISTIIIIIIIIITTIIIMKLSSVPVIPTPHSIWHRRKRFTRHRLDPCNKIIK